MNIGADAFQARSNVSRETMDRLKAYAGLLGRWNPKINLVSKGSLSQLWERHMLDSAQIFNLRPQGCRLWADLGSGGGFPGAVIAIMASEAAPDMRVTLVESDQRKAAFLRTVARETGVGFTVLANRIEDNDPLHASVVSARALAPLTVLLGFASRHLASGGIALFPKGSTAQAEIAAALESWRFDCQTYQSQTDKDAVILKIGDIERV
ncbi:16S rRNA (guanine(527)-N(7))-methyltransferase RsmG [Silicimonas sp. MF1-12-2]|uniref:16S rRNA (guanine(527)-N(7))-methyltransferase RsmG n=1 Tax=Silicimonas sp. MF1-12-2 TaxID=3384793 RepID=UPI0039B3D65B